MILVTLGPKSDDEDTWQQMAAAGADAFRVPFAKETPAAQFDKCQRIKRCKWTHRQPTVLADLPGGKPRTANVSTISLAAGDKIRLVAGTSASENAPYQIGVSFMPSDWSLNDTLIFGDEELLARIVAEGNCQYECVIEKGGALRQKRGIVNRSRPHSYATITEFEHRIFQDTRSGLVDGYIFSFVDSVGDIMLAREELSLHGWQDRLLIAKVETAQGLANISEILAASDGVLIGLGDLLVEVGFQNFFKTLDGGLLQVKKRLETRKPIIIGTELLEISSVRKTPYRAEIGFVGYVLARGCTGLLLSGETTVGDQPYGAVAWARQLLLGEVLRDTEKL